MERLITADEVAELLGIKRHSVYHLVFRKKIPCVKISRGCLRFKKSDIESWIKSKQQEVMNVPAPTATISSSKNGKRRQKLFVAGDIDRLVDQARKEAMQA